MEMNQSQIHKQEEKVQRNGNNRVNILKTVGAIFVPIMSAFKKSGKNKRNSKISVSATDAIQKLQDMELLLHKKQEFLESKIERELSQAKQYAKTNKTLALQALKRKKRFETHLQQVDGLLTTIELQRETLEGAHTDKLVIESMQIAAKALKTVNMKTNVDEVHDIMDDFAEERDKAQEMADAISKPVGFGLEDVDEDELMKEIEKMEQEELEEQLLDVELPSTSGSAPEAVAERQRQKKEKAKHEDEEQLEAMGQWAS